MVIGIDASRAFGKERTGTENYSYHLINHILRLPESKKQLFVLFIRPNTIVPDDIARPNVQIVTISLPYLWTQLGLAWQTFVTPIDVLWVPAHTLPILRRPGLSTVVTIHGLEYEYLPEYRNLLQRWYLPLSTIYATRQATRLIAVSDFTRKQLVERLKTDIKNIKVIHEGVELSEYGKTIAPRELSRILTKYKIKRPYLLFVGSLQPRKNLPFLIEVFSRLKDIPDLSLVLAGGDGWMTEEIYQASARYGVERKVRFTGRIAEADLPAIFGGALAYIQPSITEGFGLPVLEAMASRVPVLTSDGGALPEVIGKAGIVLPIGKQDEATKEIWQKEIERVVTDPRLRERLVAAGNWRLREFSWERVAKETLRVIIETKS